RPFDQAYRECRGAAADVSHAERPIVRYVRRQAVDLMTRQGMPAEPGVESVEIAESRGELARGERAVQHLVRAGGAVPWSGGREDGLIRGWPEIGASGSDTPAPTRCGVLVRFDAPVLAGCGIAVRPVTSAAMRLLPRSRGRDRSSTPSRPGRAPRHG